MRRGNGEMRNVNRAVETINAAASAIASAESRVSPPAVQKRRWSSCWSVYWCFGSQKASKRIGHAVLVPEPTPSSGTTAAPPANAYTTQAPVRIPFVAPPSSPASFLPSETPSAVQSPACSVGLNSMSSSIYSPGAPRSIFTIGPYANETQLVTPPVFSTYTTEPSTAPFTPPPESVHLTTPSSPEVPFAQLLDPIYRGGDVGPRFPSSHYEFQSYLLQPGSPVGPLISPGSAMSGSGTSSPFTDRDFPGGFPYSLNVRYGVGSSRDWGSQQASGTVIPETFRPKSRDYISQDSMVSPLPNLGNGHRINDTVMDHRVSFELTAEDVVRCVEKKPTASPRALQSTDGGVYENTNGSVNDNNVTTERPVANGDEGQRHQKQRAASLGSIKEFNFHHVNGLDQDKPFINSNWWANEKVVGREGESCTKNWSFFPMMHPGVS